MPTLFLGSLAPQETKIIMETNYSTGIWVLDVTRCETLEFSIEDDMTLAQVALEKKNKERKFLKEKSERIRESKENYTYAPADSTNYFINNLPILIATGIL